MFVPQAPAGMEDEVLFETREDFLSNLKSIADHIARPAITGTPSPSMTFALYGRWGAGKSTALKLLQRLVSDRVAQSDAAFTPSNYDAPLWEHTSDVRTTLAYTIVKGVSADAPARLERKLRALRGKEDEATATLPDERDLREAVQFLTILKEFSNAPPLLEQWMQEIATGVPWYGTEGEAGGAAKARVHTVFIDDLDRCGRRFTASLLAATSYWSGTDQANLFFIIATSQEHLLESLREHLPLGARYPEEALEKYVHLSVEVPRLLTTPREVANYLSALAGRVSTGETLDPERVEELKRLITESGASYPNCVLAPILRLSDGLTPRSVKHRFNTFLAEFRPRGKLDARDVKKWVLKAFWPDFWWRYLWDLEIRAAQEVDGEWDRTVDRVGNLKQLGEELLHLWGLEGENLTPVMAHLGRIRGTDLGDVDPHLAIYLAIDPPWQAPSLQTPKGIKHAEQPDTEPDSIDPISSSLPNPDDLVFLHYLEAEQAFDRGDVPELYTRLLALLEVTRNADLQLRSSSTVGNAALLAERLRDPDVALELHKAAVRLNPQQFNDMQNLIDFVVQNGLSDEFPEVERLLHVLQTQGQGHKPERTHVLAVRFAMAKGTPPLQLADQIELLLRELAEQPSLYQLRRIVPLLSRVGNFAAMRRACRAVLEATATNDVERYNVLRILADGLWDSSAELDQREAADLYRFILNKGLACMENPQEAEDVKHNFAVVLADLGFPNVAALLWQEIYLRQSNDEVVRRAFASHLNRMDHGRMATAVLLGQEIERLDLRPELLPARFAPDVEAWWESLPLGSHEPCDSFLNAL